MIRSIEFDLVTFSPNAVRFTTIQGQRGHADRVKKQRKAVRDVLVRHFGAQTPGLFVVSGSELRPNKIAVSFTRIAAGTLDVEENLPMSFKHVKDEIADWCGAKSDRDPIFTWGPYRQERAAPHVQRVRIEVEDLAPGEPRRVVLAETASAGREAMARVKREVTKATKHRSVCDPSATGKTLIPGYHGPCNVDGMQQPSPRKPTAHDLRDAAEGVLRRGSTLVYRPAEGASAASSGARARAEAAFAKATGRPVPVPSQGRAVAVQSALDRLHRAPVEGAPRTRPDRDPGDEAPARDLADCETCGAKVPNACRLDVGGRVVFGVHVARARAAGLHVPEDDRAHVRPARAVAPTFAATKAAGEGRSVNRRLATVPGQARLVARRAYVALPWEQPRCEACLGCEADIESLMGERKACPACEGRGYRVAKLTREPRLEGVDVDRLDVAYKVPLAERARWGSWVTLHRTERTIAAHGVCWVYLAKPG